MGNLIPTMEIQSRGWMADETEAGRVRVERVESDLVFQPLMSSMYNTSLQGSATASQQFQAEGNPFGTMDGLLITVPAGSIASPQSATVYFQFMGRKLSLAWDRYRGSNPIPVTGWVDGRHFSLDNTIKDAPSGGLGTSSGGSIFANMTPVPVALKDDGPHQCKLHFPMDLANNVQRQWLIYGYGIEGRFGVAPFSPVAIRRYLALTTSFQSVVQGTFGKGIRKLQFVNTTGGAANITMESDSNAYPAVAIANNAFWEYDFGEPVQFNRSSSAGTGVFRVKSDVAGVQMYIVQRMK